MAETKGLIERQVDPAGTRAKRLRVTERGAGLAQQAVAVVEAVDARFFEAVPDRAVLLSTLRLLAEVGDR